MHRLTTGALALLVALSYARGVAAAPQARPGAAPPPVASVDLPEIDGPPAPVPPAVINRDAQGKVTIRAVRIATPLSIDGRLDEEPYRTVEPVRDFVQQVPNEGAPATEPTEVWVFFDDKNLYVCARMVDSQPDRIIANEMRRDSNNIFQGGDSFTFVLDTFYDRRNGFAFQTNLLGALRDQAIVDGQFNESWNTIWSTKSTRTANGWTSETAVPFKSLRYRRSGPQVWGINYRRVVRWKNEAASVALIPASYGPGGISQLGIAATLTGLETPAQSGNLELKPYGVASVTRDNTAPVPSGDAAGRNDVTAEGGFDFKYGLTRSLVADVTVNTDFAQVEEDLQQVNLTRFSLFFPEKRDFFLEGQGLFGFGGRSLGNLGGGGGGGGGFGGGVSADDVPVLFFSRRIGLSSGKAVPVVAGTRVTGKAGPFDIGLLNVQTGREETAGAMPTNFSAIRFKRDILHRSSIGVIATERTPTSGGGADSQAIGADVSLRFLEDVTFNGYYARTATPGAAGDASSYRGRFDYAADRYGLTAEHLMVGPRFDPTVGFKRRDDFRRSSMFARFSPRPKHNPVIRRFVWQSTFDYITDPGGGTVQNRSLDGTFGMEFHSGDQTSVQYTHEYERLPASFEIDPGVFVPAGAYVADTIGGTYSRASQRKVSGRLSASRARFYDGTKYEAGYSGRIGFVPQFSLEPGLTLTWVRLPYGDFDARVLSTRATLTPTPRLLVSSLVQFVASTHTLSSSVRLRWEYTPGSELFVVYSDGRDTGTADRTQLLNRSFVVKITRLLRF